MANSAIEKFDKTDFGGRSIGVKEDRAPWTKISMN
jgi:hypothetical protein